MRSMSATLAAAALAVAPLTAASSALAVDVGPKPAPAKTAANTELMGGPQPAPSRPAAVQTEQKRADQKGGGFSEGEIVEEVEGWLGISAEAAADLVAKVFADLGKPNGYIKGGEASGAIAVGLRYGEGDLFMRTGGGRHVYWQGPSLGFDTGGNASRVFTLVYGLESADAIYQRYPGVEGSAYYVAGVGVNYQRRDSATLAPMRVGVGLRLGANVGYLKYSRERDIVPF